MAKKQSEKKSSQSKGKKKSAPETPEIKKRARSTVLKILPYILCIFSIILAVCFILVNFGGNAGEVGFSIQAFFCALFGPAAFALPLILGYIGVRWCIFNIQWGDEYMAATGAERVNYRRAKRKAILTAIMAILTLIMVASFIGVIAEQSDLDLGSLWDDGIDREGGGVIGGAFSCLFILCFDIIISLIILGILILLFALLALGITPNYILTKIREKHIENAALREEERKYAPQPAPQRPAKPQTGAKAPTEAPVPTPPAKEAEAQMNAQDIPIGPSEQAKPEQTKTKAQKPASTPAAQTLDYGGESDIDTNEFDTVDDFIRNLDTPIAESRGENEPAVQDTVQAEDTPEQEPKPVPLNISEIQSEELLEDMAAVALDDSDESYSNVVTPYIFPPIDFLSKNKNIDDGDHTEELQANAKILVETLRSFRVGIKEVTYSRGPTITRYELKPEVGTRVRSIANLVDDIALNLATSGVRIEAPIPGKAAVGIEVPNQTRATVYLRDLIDTPKFTDSKSKLTAALGMDVGGNPIHFDIGKMPHLLIAGTTGSGKSICINCIIISILYKAKPEELKLILIDPKKVEFNMYKNIPHLYCPIVSEPKKAAGALASAVAEMERRFELIEQAGVRDIASYNAMAETDPDLEFMPHMVIIIDELADLMMTARDEVETSICRIAQKARAAGIHMILGTQRPSVDVITGLIKANVPSRIACTVMSQVDSRTIIDVAGAENLIGRGDMLFAPVGASKPIRVQGAFVSETEIEKIVSFVKENNGEARYNTDFINKIEEEAAKCGMGKKGAATASESSGATDDKFSSAVKIAVESGTISTSLLQRRMSVGYGKAAKMLDMMEELGYISGKDGAKPRQVYLTMDEYLRRMEDGTLGGEN